LHIRVDNFQTDPDAWRMKMKSSAIVTSLVAAIVVGLTSGVVNATTFSDNFDAGANAAWGNELGNWTASGGTYSAQNPSWIPSGRSLVTGTSWSDFTLDVVVNNPTTIGDVGGIHEAGGVLLRAANNPASPLGVDGVLFVWAHAPTLEMYWHVLLPGQTCCPSLWGPAYGLVQFGPAPASFSLHIEVKGDFYSAFVNGLLITSLNNSEFSSGQVGLYSSGPQAQSFDNFSVSETPLPGALPLFATGLGALGLMIRRTKRRDAAYRVYPH
jgi:hypothetical protein